MALSCAPLWAQSPAANPAATSPSTVLSPSPNSSENKKADPPTPLEAAADLYRRGKFGEAEAAFRAIIQSDPQSAPAYVGLFRVQMRQRHVDDAAVTVKKAAEVAPNSDAVRTAQAELLFRQGKLADAQTAFTTLVKVGTSDARAYLGLGRIYWASSLFQHGKLMFEMANERDPFDPEIRKQWLFTLTLKERIRELQGYLANGNGDDEDEREHLEVSLTEMNEVAEKSSSGCRLVSSSTEAHVPMEKMMYGAQRIRGYGLKVQLNDAKSRLLIDSGATGIIVSRKVAEKAGIESIAKTDVHGIGDKGAAAGFIGAAKSIKIGDLEFQGCHVEVIEQSSVADGDGLIGSDVFSHFLVNINFPDNKLDLTPLPPRPPPTAAEKALAEKYPKIARFRDAVVPAELKDYTRVYRFGHMLLIPTRINELPAELFLIDTGAFSDTISPAAAREVTKVRADSDFKVKGLNGSVNNVFTADNLTLTFSHFRQPAKDIVAFDTTGMSNSAGAEISGMLGFNMLYQMQVKIDYRDGLVDFVYEPNRFH